jgi:hypothetical protein
VAFFAGGIAPSYPLDHEQGQAPASDRLLDRGETEDTAEEIAARTMNKERAVGR